MAIFTCLLGYCDENYALSPMQYNIKFELKISMLHNKYKSSPAIFWYVIVHCLTFKAIYGLNGKMIQKSLTIQLKETNKHAYLKA